MIYFIKTSDDQYVKIGYSLNDIKSRMSSLQTGNPLKLEFVGWCEGDNEYEKTLHNFFKEYKTEADNEWFLYSDKIKRFIALKTKTDIPAVRYPLHIEGNHKCKANHDEVDDQGWFLCQCGKRMIFAFPSDGKWIDNFGKGRYWRMRNEKYGKFNTKIHGTKEEFIEKLQKKYNT